MNKSLPSIVIALLGSAVVPATLSSPPVPGPGGVASAVRTFLERIDGGGDVAALLADRDHEIDFVIAADGSLATVDDAATPVFLDVDRDGAPIAAQQAARFVEQLAGKVAGDAGTLRSEVRAIRANCDSERCSLAIVEFDRVYTNGDGGELRRPMRATALLQWERTAGEDFRIYHWHASPAGEAVAKAEGKKAQ